MLVCHATDELEKWAKDKPKSLVMLSVYIATAADTVFFNR